MKSSIPSITSILVIVFLICGCKPDIDKVNIPIPDEPIIIHPYPPKIGMPITVSYNPKHPKALYKDEQFLFATLTIISQNDVSVMRIPLKNEGAEILILPSITLPNDGVGIDISIAPNNVYMTQEHFSTALANEQLNPPKGGTPFMMRTSSHNYQEAISLFNEDKELYPDDFERYALLWYGKIRSGMPKQPILQSIDSVWQYLKSSTTLSSEQQLGVVACSMGYALLDKPNEADAAIKFITSHSSIKTSLRHGAVECLENIFRKTVESLKNLKGQEVKNWQSLFETVAEFSIAHSNFRALSAVFRPLPTIDINEDITHFNDTIQHVYRKIARKLITLSNQKEALQYTATNPALWLTVGNTMNVLNDLDDAAILFEIGKKMLNKIPEWASNDNYSPVSSIPLGRIRSDYALNYLKVASSLNQLQRADSIIAWAWSFPVTAFSKKNYSMLATAQANKYLSSQMIDSAEKYCALAIYLNDNSSSEIFAKLQNLRYTKGKKKESLPQFKERTKALAMPLELIPSMVLQTQELQKNRSVNIANIKDTTTYLFFSSKTCSVCRLFIPRIIPAIATASSPCKAIVVTDEPIYQARKYYGIGASYVAFRPDMQIIFGVGAFPTVFKIKNGVIIQRFDGLSESSTKEIIEQLTK